MSRRRVKLKKNWRHFKKAKSESIRPKNSQYYPGDFKKNQGFSLYQFNSVAQLCPTLLWPNRLQQARLCYSSPTPRACSNSSSLSRWCHPTISCSIVRFSSCLQSFSASGSFLMSQLFSWGGQSTGVSALASFLPKKCQGWSPSEWTGCTSLQSKGLSRVFSNTTVQKHQFLGPQLSL